jgi:hypothetical protein
MEDDLALLRRFEPVIRFNHGELFYPTSVEDFVASSALYDAGPKEPEIIAERGTLDLNSLAHLGREHAGKTLFLQQVDKPLNRKQYKQWKRRANREKFKFSSRFAAVGLIGRFVDALMRLTLLLRGNVPGGYAAASHIAYTSTPRHEQCYYYGHVSRDAGYVILQYWFFYSMNDWRSTFGGVNDHESDWEQVTIFLTEDHEPRWVAFSSHDEVGDDLRRRWDDPDIEYVDGSHPVVYAGAGSHSGAYLPGEYLITAPLPIPEWLDGVRRGIIRLLPWRGQAGQGTVGIPYIDYKRGDGLCVGPGGNRPWNAVVVTDDTNWVRDFRGLWGLDTRDFLGGERAPAGMRYERNETVRESWGQPVAWSGLDREPPTEAWAMRDLVADKGDLELELVEVVDQLTEAREELRAARAAERAQGRSPRKPTQRLAELARRVTDLRKQQVALINRIEAAELGIESTELPPEDVHAHLSHRAVPMTAANTMRGRLLRVWSAASASVLLAALGILLLAGHSGLIWPVIWISFAMLIIESILRQRFLQMLVVSVIVAVTIIALLALWEIFTGNMRVGIGALLIIISVYLVAQTAREAIRTR